MRLVPVIEQEKGCGFFGPLKTTRNDERSLHVPFLMVIVKEDETATVPLINVKYANRIKRKRIFKKETLHIVHRQRQRLTVCPKADVEGAEGQLKKNRSNWNVNQKK